MSLITKLWITIAILSIVIIIETVWLVILYKGKRESDWQLNWFIRSHH